MTDAVTQRDVEAVCRRINRIVNGTDETSVWERVDGEYRANVGVYYVDGAYGGVALYRVANESGGVTDVFRIGHVTKRQLRDAMFAFIEGISLVDDMVKEGTWKVT